MSAFTDSDLLEIAHSSNRTKYYTLGVYSDFSGLDLVEYTKIARSYSGTSNVDYWDTVKDSTVSGLSGDGDYPNYDIKDNGDIIEFRDL